MDSRFDITVDQVEKFVEVAERAFAAEAGRLAEWRVTARARLVVPTSGARKRDAGAAVGFLLKNRRGAAFWTDDLTWTAASFAWRLDEAGKAGGRTWDVGFDRLAAGGRVAFTASPSLLELLGGLDTAIHLYALERGVALAIQGRDHSDLKVSAAIALERRIEVGSRKERTAGLYGAITLSVARRRDREVRRNYGEELVPQDFHHWDLIDRQLPSLPSREDIDALAEEILVAINADAAARAAPRRTATDALESPHSTSEGIERTPQTVAGGITACFALACKRFIWDALVEACQPIGPEHLLDLAAERLRQHFPGSVVARETDAIVVELRDPASLEATARALERIATREPYPFGDGLMFFPFACGGVTGAPSSGARKAALASRRRGAALVLGDTMAASELVLFGARARIGGDASCEIRIPGVDYPVALVEQRGSDMYIEPLEDSLASFGGRDLEKQQIHGPQALMVSNLVSESVVVLFESAAQVPHFARHQEYRDHSAHYIAAARVASGTRDYGVIAIASKDATPSADDLTAALGVPAYLREVAVARSVTTITICGTANRVEEYASKLGATLGITNELGIAFAVPRPTGGSAAVVDRAIEDAKRHLKTQ